jgi:hypothetical protein
MTNKENFNQSEKMTGIMLLLEKMLELSILIDHIDAIL